MKLISRVNVNNLIGSLIVLFIGSFIFYFAIQYIIYNNINERLDDEKEIVEEYILKFRALPVTAIDIGDKLSFKIVDKKTIELMRDTVLKENDENELLPYRIYKFPVLFNGKYYEATIIKELVESEYILQTVVVAMLIITSLLLVMQLTINTYFAKIVLKPFNFTLHKIKEFNISSKEKILLPKTNVNEFTELNNSLNAMADKMQLDYKSLKQFTENASHEIQTPLAIIQSKLELLLQSKDMDDVEYKLLQQVYEASNRLSKLNQALLMLTRIDNYQFNEVKTISLTKITNEIVTQYEEYITHKNITIIKDIETDFSCTINEVLARSMMSNIISNAIKYNINGGTITIYSDKTGLKISNTGDDTVDTERLFERFQKANPASNSLGLGLSIVRSIANVYKLNTTYSFSNKIHSIFIQNYNA